MSISTTQGKLLTYSRYAFMNCMLSCDLIDTKALRHEDSQRGRAATKEKLNHRFHRFSQSVFLGVQFDQHTTLSDGV